MILFLGLLILNDDRKYSFLLKIKKEIQTNSEGEFVNKMFANFLTTNGIFHHLLCLYTPQQNGFIECKHRHIVGIGLCLLSQAFLPSKFWVDAFPTVVFLINHSPIKQLDYESPYKKISGKNPNYTFLKVIGYTCFPL